MTKNNFKVGDVVLQIKGVQPGENPKAVVTMVTNDTIWHQHVGAYKSNNAHFTSFQLISSYEENTKLCLGKCESLF